MKGTLTEAVERLFQSTHSYRVRLLFPCQRIAFGHYFNPRTRTEYDDDLVGRLLKKEREISIHALVQSATSIRARSSPSRIPISIHALVQSATLRSGSSLAWWSEYFNPRTRTECDLDQSLKQIKDARFQSTHSYRVRRGAVSGACEVVAYFNPRTRTECDGWCRLMAESIRDFNPRTRTECDLTPQNINDPSVALFQSTHSYRVRLLPF